MCQAITHCHNDGLPGTGRHLRAQAAKFSAVGGDVDADPIGRRRLGQPDQRLDSLQADRKKAAGLEILRVGPRRHKHERRILSFDETARVIARLEEPHKLIIETCIATGARISEVLGLHWKHVNLDAATIKIEQRVWHQDIGPPKSEDSRRVLGIGDLSARYREKAKKDIAKPDSWVFHQSRAPQRPLWDSGVRDALHQAANAEGCDFPGLGPHSFRRANITWRQQVGGSAIEASKIAGHSDLEMTGQYTFVAPERQNELTRRIHLLRQRITRTANRRCRRSQLPRALPKRSQYRRSFSRTVVIEIRGPNIALGPSSLAL